MQDHENDGKGGTRLQYHVAASCTGCRLCEALASENFARIPGTDVFRVVKQPESREEYLRCEDARNGCHMHVIRTHGTIGG